MGVALFEVPILVFGGEDDGSSSASFLRAMTVLNVVYNTLRHHFYQAQSCKTHKSLVTNKPSKLPESLLRAEVQEIIEADVS